MLHRGSEQMLDLLSNLPWFTKGNSGAGVCSAEERWWLSSVSALLLFKEIGVFFVFSQRSSWQWYHQLHSLGRPHHCPSELAAPLSHLTSTKVSSGPLQGPSPLRDVLSSACLCCRMGVMALCCEGFPTPGWEKVVTAGVYVSVMCKDTKAWFLWFYEELPLLK